MCLAVVMLSVEGNRQPTHDAAFALTCMRFHFFRLRIFASSYFQSVDLRPNPHPKLAKKRRKNPATIFTTRSFAGRIAATESSRLVRCNPRRAVALPWREACWSRPCEKVDDDGQGESAGPKLSVPWLDIIAVPRLTRSRGAFQSYEQTVMLSVQEIGRIVVDHFTLHFQNFKNYADVDKDQPK